MIIIFYNRVPVELYIDRNVSLYVGECTKCSEKARFYLPYDKFGLHNIYHHNCVVVNGDIDINDGFKIDRPSRTLKPRQLAEYNRTIRGKQHANVYIL